MPNIDITVYRPNELQYAESSSGEGAALYDITYDT